VSFVLRCGIKMSANANSLAILDSAGRVITFVRLDVPEGWVPPENCTAVPDDELPEGWEYAPPDPMSVPPQVSARQIRLWLIKHGVTLSAVESAIDAIPDTMTREMVRVEWEYAPYVERTHPMVDVIGQALNLSAAQIDAGFIEAAGL